MNKFIKLLDYIIPVKDTTLPNIWLLVEHFTSLLNVKYCISYNSFYIYHGNILNKLTNEELQKIFLDFIQLKFPSAYTSFQLNNISQVLILLKRNTISLPECQKEANSNGFLLPFLNGVFNTLTLQLLPHSATNYITHMIPLQFDFTASTLVNTPMSMFLTAICNNSLIRLNILRACLNCLFTNDLSNQVALYIYGPGGTGKSTLINILMYLIGPQAALTTSLVHLNSRFGPASLLGKLFLMLSDISLYRGLEPKIIKELITGDYLMAEFKFLNPFQFIPRAFLIITSNVLWDIKNATTGMSRRFIYFPFDFIPNNKMTNLFNIDGTGRISGMLPPFFSAFIIWILTCPKEYLDLLKLGGLAITKLISTDGILTYPLQMWVSEWLIYNRNCTVFIGNNKSNPTTLYGNYLAWAILNGVTPLKFNQFSNLLIDLLNSMKWQVEKKRKATGAVLLGVELRDRPLILPSIKLGTGHDAITDEAFSINKINK